ncbi:subtilisin family serine protease [Haloactinopolyspora alba]|uniref:alpha-amylase n=1 Tax=Haloactinopolyspora alba TaxID=648780 RepID=A0A2P8DT16_9ACTN|nr:S8 family serine peptidase [Haloactinopolyspora alba]PSL00359.1 subtilisin family serine protease [Haloactinopolyspora alba]
MRPRDPARATRTAATMAAVAVLTAGGVLTAGAGPAAESPTAPTGPAASTGPAAPTGPAASTSSLAPSTPRSTDAAATAPEDKLTAGVKAALREQPETDYWVRFADQPDLSAAAEITDWAERGRYVVDTLRAAAEESQAGVVAQLEAADVAHESYWAANAVLVEGGDEELAEELATSDEVEAIAETTTFALEEPVEVGPADTTADDSPGDEAEWGVEAINAPDVWAQGFTGEGITVANIDSGVDVTHPALAESYRGTTADGTVTGDYSWWEPSTFCGGKPCDTDYHGTHTMGTMVGDGGPGNHIGVAPGADWIASNALAYGSDAVMLEAAQWFLAPTRTDGTAADPAQRPHVINNSWGGGGPAIRSVMPDVLRAWEAAGIFAVWSNGNTGPLCETTGRPGGLDGAYSVGAFDEAGAIAGFSSRGTGPDGTVKPDIAAPGVQVRSAFANHEYRPIDGTSMASPHVAGAVALLWSAAPSLVGDVDRTRALLDDSARDKDDTTCGGTADDNQVWGEGMLDVEALVAAAPTEAAAIEGTLLGPEGAALDGATVTVGEGPDARSTATDAEGRFTLRVAPGEHTVTARAPGYLPATSSVTVADGATARLDLTLEVSPRYSLSGTVQDSAHQQIAGATVTVSAPGAPTVSTTTDATGAFVVEDLPVDSYMLQVTGDRCTEDLTDRVDVDADTVHDATLDRRSDTTGYTCTVGTAGVRTGDTPLAMEEAEYSGELGTTELPFAFPFYGETYRDVTVADSGWISFLPQDGAWDRAFRLPAERRNPKAAIFAHHNSFVLDEQSGIYTAETTLDGTEAFVVEWRNVVLSFRDSRATFSATLYADGRVELGYGDTDPVWLTGVRATIGIENASGTDAFQYSHSSPDAIHDGKSVMFARPEWGRVTGTLVDALDHEPVADVEVRLVPEGGGRAHSMWTGDDGSYALAAPPGTYDLSIAPQHYERITERVVITEDLQEIDLSPQLRTGAAEVTGGDWTRRLVQGESVTTELTVRNAGTAPLTASVGTMVPADDLDAPPAPTGRRVAGSPPVVSAPGAERAPSSRGTAIGQFYSDAATPLGVGLHPDGEVWNSDIHYRSPRNLRHSRAGELLGEHDARVDPGDDLRALTWDSTSEAMCQSVYRADRTSVIRCYDDEQKPAHELTGVWSANPVYGIAHDSRTDVFHVAVPSIDAILTVAGTTHDTPGELLSRCAPEHTDPVGLAFNTTSDTLWMSSNWAEQAFIQLDPKDCSTLRTVAAPAGVIDGAVLDLATDVTGALWAVDRPTNRIRLVDVGDPQFASVAWVSADPAPMTLEPGESASVPVTFDTAGLDPGTYTTDVAVVSSAGRAPVQRLPVTVEVVAPYDAAIDVGGPGRTDTAGNVWAGDRALPAGPLPDGEHAWGWTDTSEVKTTKKEIAGTDEDALFRTMQIGAVAYTFRDVPAGSFDVALGFVDRQPNPRPGGRIVDVLVDGRVVVDDLDVAAEVGGLSALQRTVTTQHDGGDLDVVVRPDNADRTPGLATLRLVQRSLGG